MKNDLTILESEMCVLFEEGLTSEAVAYFSDKWLKNGQSGLLELVVDAMNGGVDKNVAFCMAVSRYFTMSISEETISITSNN